MPMRWGTEKKLSISHLYHSPMVFCPSMATHQRGVLPIFSPKCSEATSPSPHSLLSRTVRSQRQESPRSPTPLLLAPFCHIQLTICQSLGSPSRPTAANSILFPYPHHPQMSIVPGLQGKSIKGRDFSHLPSPCLLCPGITITASFLPISVPLQRKGKRGGNEGRREGEMENWREGEEGGRREGQGEASYRSIVIFMV